MIFHILAMFIAFAIKFKKYILQNLNLKFSKYYTS